MKLRWSEANQRMTRLALDLLGPDGQILPGDAPSGRLAPAAAEPGQHDRGRHVGDAAQHRDRARARPPEVTARWTSTFTSMQDELRSQTRSFLEATSWPTSARPPSSAGRVRRCAEEHGGAGLTFLEEAVLHKEAGRALLHAPLWSTSCLLPFLDGRRSGPRGVGETSWTLALCAACPRSRHGDQRRGRRRRHDLGARGVRARGARDERRVSRPLGVVSGGEPGRALCSSEVLPALRSRSLTILALEAVGVGQRALELAGRGTPRTREQFGRIGSAPTRRSRTRSRTGTAGASSSLARSLVGGVVRRRTTSRTPQVAAAAAKSGGGGGGRGACERAIQSHGGIGLAWEHVLHRLYKRALGYPVLGGVVGAAPRRGRRVTCLMADR